MGAPAAGSYNRSMKILVKAVISGFGFSLGAALFKKVSDKLGLSDDKPSAAREEIRPDPSTVASKRTEPEGGGPLGSAGFEGV
jgi:hypothetical protein